MVWGPRQVGGPGALRNADLPAQVGRVTLVRRLVRLNCRSTVGELIVSNACMCLRAQGGEGGRDASLSANLGAQGDNVR